MKYYICWIGLIVSFFFFLNETIARESVFIKKYGFGFERRSSDGKPVPYLRAYPVAEDNSESNDSSDDIDVKLIVEQSAENVLAVVIFTNNSSQSYFLPKKYYPMRFEKWDGEMFDALCGNKISITTGDISLDYLRGSCPFDFDSDVSGWVEIKPTKRIFLKIKINDMFAFLPGEHDYFIKTLKYKLVRSKWFVLQSIDKNFSAIFTKQNICDRYNSEAILNSEITCGDYKFNEYMSFGMEHFMEKDDRENSIYVSSNEVSVKIDGSKVKHPY